MKGVSKECALLDRDCRCFFSEMCTTTLAEWRTIDCSADHYSLNFSIFFFVFFKVLIFHELLIFFVLNVALAWDCNVHYY